MISMKLKEPCDNSMVFLVMLRDMCLKDCQMLYGDLIQHGFQSNIYASHTCCFVVLQVLRVYIDSFCTPWKCEKVPCEPFHHANS